MPDPRDDYLDPYRQSHRHHGTGFDVTLWASPRTQALRFAVFTQMLYLPGKRILDAGCSRGDFASYLIQHDVAFASYVGVDGLPQVIEFATQRRLPGCTFVAGDILRHPHLLRTGDPQIIAISGTLNTMTDAQAYALLDESWKAAGEALIFNFLSDRHTHDAPRQDEGPARRLNTVALVDWALARTPMMALRHDYFKHGHDATIAMRRPT